MGFFFGVFVITCLNVQATGAHYNPAITFTFMIKQKQRVSSRFLGFGYMVYQICGAIFGALIAMGFTNYGGDSPSNVGVA